MNTISYNRQIIEKYLSYCQVQKRLDIKTIKSYRIDLAQFIAGFDTQFIEQLTKNELELYITRLHQQYKPKSVKRKIASLKAFYNFLEYNEMIERSPFCKLKIHFREPMILPKTIPLYDIELLLSKIYEQEKNAKTIYQKRNALRDAAIVELLFSSGMRISELCHLKEENVDLHDGTILILGKGSKERRIQIGNIQVVEILAKYHADFAEEISNCNHFFVSQSGLPISDQSIRRMINKYSSLAGIKIHITPHMFRHTFATCLLEADVDIRYIQEMLGHSSINTTEIYTHVSVSKQRRILADKHPRKDFSF